MKRRPKYPRRKIALIASGGSSKGGGAAHVATEDPDTLTSRSQARIKEVLTEGESPGLVNGLKSIALDGTPIQDPGGEAFTDGITILDSPIFKCVAARFYPSDKTRGIVGDNIPLNTTILEVHSPTEVKLSANCTANGTGKTFSLDGSLNFSNFDFFLLPGTQDQSYVPGFDAEENSTAVGVRVKKLTPWTHRVTDEEVNGVRVDIRFPRMVSQNTSNGDTHGTSVQLIIELQSDNGGYNLVVNDTINGKATSPYIRTYMIALVGAPPWDIKVTRVTADSTSEALSNQTWVDSFTEVIWGKLRHPNSVVAAIAIDAEQFGNIPVRSYEMYGIIIQVPTNYDPVARTYAETGPGTSGGIWDGTWKTAWTNNAAWCWYAMLTNTRWGLGRFVDASKINLGALYTAAKVCDEMVPDGYGGTEPRYTCALYLQQGAPAIQVMRDMATIFRAMVYYSNGWLVPVIDSPNPTVAHQFTPENVIDGKFNYHRGSRTARHNYVTVMYSDMTNFGKPGYVNVEDEADIRKRGIVPTNITALGCTSRAAAWRIGKWLILSEKLDRMVDFATGQQGMHLRPGDVIDTHDPYRAGKRWSGVVKSATTTTVVLDKQVELEDGKAYWLSLLKKADGDDGPAGSVIRKAVLTAGPVTTNTLTFAAMDSDEEPDSRTVWILVASDLQPERWKIIHSMPNDLATVALTALPYNATKFDNIDADPGFDPLPVSTLPSASRVLPPGAITINTGFINAPQLVQRVLEVSWEPSLDRFLRGYLVRYRVNGGNYIPLHETPVASCTIPFLTSGFYEVEVKAINTLGFKSVPSNGNMYIADSNYTIQMRVTGLELVGQGNDTIFTQADAKFQWRINSPTVAVELGSEGANGLLGPKQDPFFEKYEVKIFDGTIELLKEFVTDTQYVFTAEKNKEATGGIGINTFRIEVRACDRFENKSPADRLTVSNPPTDPVTNAKVKATLTGFLASWINPVAVDGDHIEILMSTDAFDVAPELAGEAAWGATTAAVNLFGERTDEIVAGGGVPHYFWIVAVDTFGNKSAAVFAGSVNPGSVIGIILLTPNGGHIGSAVTAHATCPQQLAAQIYWRADSTQPTTADNLYDDSVGIPISGTGDLSLIAYFAGDYGEALHVSFVLDPTGVQTPIFDTIGGSYSSPTGTKNIDVYTTTLDAQMRYTTGDGTQADPTDSVGTLIASAVGVITLPVGHTNIKIVAFKPTWTISAVAEADFTIVQDAGGDGTAVSDPVSNKESDLYNVYPAYSLIAHITTSAGAKMRFTTDGTQPTSGSSGHGTLIDGDAGNVSIGVGRKSLKIIAWSNGLHDSNVVTYEYTVQRSSIDI